MIISAHPRLVATTMTLGEKRVERPMPEKRPARKLTQRVVVSEAACKWSSIYLQKTRGRTWLVETCWGVSLCGPQSPKVKLWL